MQTAPIKPVKVIRLRRTAGSIVVCTVCV